MDSEAASLYPVTFSISKKPTTQQRWKDARPILLFFAGCFLLGFLLPPLSVFFGMPLWFATGSNYLLFLLGMVLVGAAAGFLIVYTVRSVSRGILGGDRKRVAALENRLRAGSNDVISDLDSLITENLKLGRPQVAEYYSKQLLVLCERDLAEPTVPDLMISTAAWASTPAYHKSVNYWLVWMFQSRGLLCLTNEHLEYESARISFRVALKDVIDIGLDRHPLWMKPFPLRFIKIRFREPDYDIEHCMYVTPYTMQTDTVWDINKSVQEWYSNLTTALAKVC